MDSDKLSKLPKWAQDEIDVLKRRIKYLESQITQLDGTTETRIAWTSGIHDDDHGLPEHAMVTFVIWNNAGNKTAIEVNLDSDDCCALRVHSIGSRISIEPDSGSNSIIVRAIR